MKKLLFVFPFILLSGISFSQAISFNYDLAGNRVKRKSACDLTVTMDIDGLLFSPNAKRDFVVNLYEVNSVETTGPITLRISKAPIFTITYPLVSGTSNVFGGSPHNNSDWAFSENANFITMTSKAGFILPSAGHSVIGFTIARNAGTLAGVEQNLTSVVVAGSGDEANSANNSVVINVHTN